MFLDMCLLTFIAYRYKYIDVAPRTPKMEDVVTTETNNSVTEIPNRGSRKPSTTTETIELNILLTSNQSSRKLD